MKRILFFSLFLFLLLPGLSGAWSDDCERYESSPTENWYITGGTLTTDQYPTTYPLSHTLKYMVGGYGGGTGSKSLISNEYIFHDYTSFVLKKVNYYASGSHCTGSLIIRLRNADNTIVATRTLYTWDTYGTTVTITTPHLYEFVKVGTDVYLYDNGVSIGDIGNVASDLKLDILVTAYSQYSTCEVTVWIDDITDSSIIGTDQVFTEISTALTPSYSIQSFSSYPNSIYSIDTYSITNSVNAGLVNSSILNSSNGIFSLSRGDVFGLNYGLYQLQLKRDNDILTSTYVFYDNLASPVGYPECLFIAGANTETEIKDQDLNGGTISAGETTYLYPSVSDSGIYNFTYNILEAPFSLETTIQTIYNTSALNQTNFFFTGLSSQSYYVSVDGEEIESTNNLDVWNYTFYNDSSNHIFNFDLDYRAPGVWGYIKNSETQSPIKSATVTISNSSNTYYITTDSNGMYYKTKDLITGSYNVSAAKSGYTSSLTYNAPTQENITTRQDIFLDPIQGSGVYYASHDVTFTVLEYWYSSAGLPDVSYAVYDDENESVKNGTTGSKGTFTVTDMDAGKNYTFILTYNNQTYTEYLEPGLTEYTLVLNKEGIVHQYFNSWLNLTYAENSNNATILYTSNKTVSEASFIVTASNGTIVQSNTLNTTSGTFLFNFTEGDYILQFNIEASDGSTASQAWSVSSPPEVTLFPASYPTWLKNTLFVAIIIIFLLAFGKSKNDIACGAVAVLTSLGYYFEWLSCGFNFVVLIWIIALGAIFLHYKRTGAVG